VDVAGVTARDTEDAEVAQKVKLDLVGMPKSLAKKNKKLLVCYTENHLSTAYCSGVGKAIRVECTAHCLSSVTHCEPFAALQK